MSRCRRCGAESELCSLCAGEVVHAVAEAEIQSARTSWEALCDALDRIAAAYISARPTKRPSNTTVMELLHWAAKQREQEAHGLRAASKN